jgi:hypothetical protein
MNWNTPVEQVEARFAAEALHRQQLDSSFREFREIMGELDAAVRGVQQAEAQGGDGALLVARMRLVVARMRAAQHHSQHHSQHHRQHDATARSLLASAKAAQEALAEYGQRCPAPTEPVSSEPPAEQALTEQQQPAHVRSPCGPAGTPATPSSRMSVA